MKIGRKSVGHPIDVATGVVYSDYEDITIPGKVNLTWGRYYSTALLEKPSSPLGPGWTTRYFATLTQSEGEFQFITPEGEIEIFADPDATVDRGGIVRNLGTFQEIYRRGDEYIVTLWDVNTGEVECYVFKSGNAGEEWPLSSIEDVTGWALDMVRDAAGRLIGIRQRFEKRELLIDYNAQDRITCLVLLLPGNRRRTIARYEYDMYGRQIAAHDALGHADHYEYDRNSRLTRETLKTGGTFFFKYDANGRCVKTSGLDGYDYKTFRYMSHIGVTEVTDSLGNVWQYHANGGGQLVKEVSPLGASTVNEYDDHCRITKRVDPNGGGTEFKYDEAGNLAEVTNALGHSAKVEYNTRRQVSAHVDPSDNRWDWAYDQQGQLIDRRDPVDRRWTYSYDAQGNLTTMTGPDGVWFEFEYNERGNNSKLTDSKSNVTRYAWNDEGQLVERVNSLDHWMRYQYNATGQVVSVQRDDGTKVRLTYHVNGKLANAMDEKGNLATRYTYDAYGRVQEYVDLTGQRLMYVRGTEPGQVLKVQNDKNESSRFEYDKDGRVVHETRFDGRKRSFTYDLAGNCIAVETASGLIKLERDPLGRLIKRTLPDGNEEIFSYDERGYLVEATNKDCQVFLRYDAVGRVEEETCDGLTIKNVHGSWGRLRRISPWGTVTEFEFDGEDVRAIRLPNGRKVTWDIDPLGHVKASKLSNGLEERYTYDSRYRTTMFHLVDRDGQTVTRRHYEYDAIGNILKIDDWRKGIREFGYDMFNRLTTVSVGHGVSERLAFDSSNNITKLRQGEEQTSFEYVEGGRLCERIAEKDNRRIRYFYDEDGNIITKHETVGNSEEITRYEYDARNQLIAVETPNHKKIEFQYDAFGRRIRKRSIQGETVFVWEGYSLLGEKEISTDARHGEFIEYVFGARGPVCRIEREYTYFYHNDHLGTPHELTDNLGNIVWSATQTSYGQVVQVDIDTVSNPLRFQGHYYDTETGLNHNVFRYYDPETARYLQQDPIGLAGGANLYIYTHNPLFFLDPLGLMNGQSEMFPLHETPGGNQVPHYSRGGATSGVLVRPNGTETPIVSGEGGAARNTCGIPGMHGNIKPHVEAHTAATMRREELTEGTLYINRHPCQLHPSGGCHQNLRCMLPPGARLRVIGPDGFDRVYVGDPDPPGRDIDLEEG